MPAKRNSSGLGGGTRAKSTTNKARGQASPPANPTGRLVLSTGVQGGAVTSHWCPKEGTSWTCEVCGQEFVRDEDLRGVAWRSREGVDSSAS